MLIIFGTIGVLLFICGIAVYGKTCGHGSTLVEAECVDIVDGYPVYCYEFLEKQYTSTPGLLGRSKKNPSNLGKCHIFINGRVPTTIYSYGLRNLGIAICITGVIIAILPLIMLFMFIAFLFNLIV